MLLKSPLPLNFYCQYSKEKAFDIAMNFSKWGQGVFELPKMITSNNVTGMMWKMTFDDDGDDDEYGVI